MLCSQTGSTMSRRKTAETDKWRPVPAGTACSESHHFYEASLQPFYALIYRKWLPARCLLFLPYFEAVCNKHEPTPYCPLIRFHRNNRRISPSFPTLLFSASRSASHD